MNQLLSISLKFIYSEKATKFLEELKKNRENSALSFYKGQLISKCLMVSPKKRTNKFAFSTQTAFHDAKRRLVKKDEFVRSFFGRILGATRLF